MRAPRRRADLPVRPSMHAYNAHITISGIVMKRFTVDVGGPWTQPALKMRLILMVGKKWEQRTRKGYCLHA